MSDRFFVSVLLKRFNFFASISNKLNHFSEITQKFTQFYLSLSKMYCKSMLNKCPFHTSILELQNIFNTTKFNLRRVNFPGYTYESSNCKSP
jgi:hypothetical protein